MTKIPPVSLDIKAWTAFYNAMHDQLISNLALAESSVQVLPKDSPGYAGALWNEEHLHSLHRFLDVTDLIVKKLDRDQPLLDFVEKLREAHENETRTRESLR